MSDGLYMPRRLNGARVDMRHVPDALRVVAMAYAADTCAVKVLAEEAAAYDQAAEYMQKMAREKRKACFDALWRVRVAETRLDPQALVSGPFTVEAEA
jgi:hypothetical protein